MPLEATPVSFTPSTTSSQGKNNYSKKPMEAIAAVEQENEPPKRRQKIYERKTKSPLQSRSRLLDGYEAPMSGREAWWRSTIKETPGPGSYDSRDFISEIKRRPNTYRFKASGRKGDPQPHIGKGQQLMPGAYNYKDLAKLLDDEKKSYCFKNTERSARDFLTFGVKDKDVNVCPTSYDTAQYQSLSVDKAPSKHWVFRSQSQRFPTIHFKPKDGPSPGNYDYTPPSNAHVVSSTFKSKTPRFSSSHSRVPGPGIYDKTVQFPMPRTISDMGRKHGLFFSSAFTNA